MDLLRIAAALPLVCVAILLMALASPIASSPSVSVRSDAGPAGQHHPRRSSGASGVSDRCHDWCNDDDCRYGCAGLSKGRRTGRRGSFRNPEWVEFDRVGNLIVADRGNHVLRRIDARNGTISTIVGTGTFEAAGDGGPAAEGRADKPVRVHARSGMANIFIFDTEAHSIRRVDVKSDDH